MKNLEWKFPKNDVNDLLLANVSMAGLGDTISAINGRKTRITPYTPVYKQEVDGQTLFCQQFIDKGASING